MSTDDRTMGTQITTEGLLLENLRTKRKSLMSLRQVEILDELKTKQLSILVF